MAETTYGETVTNVKRKTFPGGGSIYRTRKPCYRKDDRAMRPIGRCPENFRESLTTSTPSCLPNF